jgi:hypothetical protein
MDCPDQNWLSVTMRAKTGSEAAMEDGRVLIRHLRWLSGSKLADRDDESKDWFQRSNVDSTIKDVIQTLASFCLDPACASLKDPDLAQASARVKGQQRQVQHAERAALLWLMAKLWTKSPKVREYWLSHWQWQSHAAVLVSWNSAKMYLITGLRNTAALLFTRRPSSRTHFIELAPP